MKLPPPTPEAIAAARAAAGHTQAQAAALVGLSRRDRWSEMETGKRPMDLARWELYLLLTNQHPVWRLVKRAAPAKPNLDDRITARIE